jgi:ribosomal protein S27AE
VIERPPSKANRYDQKFVERMLKMGIYQNYTPSERTIKTMDSSCPRCSQLKVPVGMYLVSEVTIPFKLKILFFSVTIDLMIKFSYCPRCGFLRMELFQK